MNMRIYVALGVFIAAVLFMSLALAGPMPVAQKKRAVVVELFTSEGCSSCPPADQLLGRLGREEIPSGIDVIPLGFHVDYWNTLGWKDRFSSASYTHRQEVYAQKLRVDGPYTPQMIVNGESQFVGSSRAEARRAIEHASLESQPAEVALSISGSGTLLVRVGGAPAGEVMLAITEDNLETKVGRGENSGRTLHHDAVVREFDLLGQVENGAFHSSVPLTLRKEWKPADLRVVVFVQEPGSGKIVGAGSLKPF
jgi:hypothetical protein